MVQIVWGHIQRSWKRYTQKTPIILQYRHALMTGVALIFGVIILLSTHHAQSITDNITRSVHQTLADRPLLLERVVVEGTQVYLAGEIEPHADITTQVEKISRIPGVTTVTNKLVATPMLSAHLQLNKKQQDLFINGQLSSRQLETLLQIINAQFPDMNLIDRIQIDDRIGVPLWLDGIDHSLSHLDTLDEFELNGWRDKIVLTGNTNNYFQQRQLGYAVPASLTDLVTVTNRLSTPSKPGYATLRISANWSGVWIDGVVPTQDIASQIIEAAKSTFGIDAVTESLQLDTTLVGNSQLASIIQMMPHFAPIQSFSLQTSEQGYVVRGTVDNPFQLGNILGKRNQLGLETTLISEIDILPGEKPSSTTIFNNDNWGMPFPLH